MHLNLLHLLSLLLLPACTLAADSYDIVDQPSDFTSDFRVLIGVPGDDFGREDGGRSKMRRAKIQKIVEGHVERMADKTDIEGPSIQYSFMPNDDLGFIHFFPKHTKHVADGEEQLSLPAVRMMNIKTGDFMLPDWDILLMDLPDELDRLVTDFERWMHQTDDVVASDDGVMDLHSKNIESAVFESPLLFTMFYAPWCKFSQLMIPKVSGASVMVAGLAAKNLLPPASVAVGKVNVDEEGGLRKAYNVSTYPTLLMLSPPTSSDLAGGLAANGRKKDGTGLTSTPYTGDGESAADIAAHLATLAYGSPTLASTSDVESLTGLVKAVDELFAGEEVGTAEDGGKKAASVAIITFPSVAIDQELVGAVAAVIGGKQTFVASTADPDLAQAALAKLGFPSQTADAKAALDAKEPQLLVATRHNGVLAVPLPAGRTNGERLSRATTRDIITSVWPLVSRFSSNAAQGERIRSGVMADLVVLVADEQDDFMFEGFKGALTEAAEQHRGKAHFLYADDDEPRIAPLLRSAGVAAGGGPVVIIFSMGSGDGPRVLPADQISFEGISAALTTAPDGEGAGGAAQGEEL